MTRAILIAAILITVTRPSLVTARLMQSWSYQDLFAKSDVVAIAEPLLATHDTNERTTLRDTAVRVVGVATEFRTLLMLKGSKQERLTLHHYRLQDRDIPLLNCPALFTFDPEKNHRRYLLFLIREPDGRFAPVAGETDLNISVQEIQGIAE